MKKTRVLENIVPLGVARHRQLELTRQMHYPIQYTFYSGRRLISLLHQINTFAN